MRPNTARFVFRIHHRAVQKKHNEQKKKTSNNNTFFKTLLCLLCCCSCWIGVLLFAMHSTSFKYLIKFSDMVLTFPILYSIYEMHRRIISCILLFLFIAPIPIPECAHRLFNMPFARIYHLTDVYVLILTRQCNCCVPGTCSTAQWHHL